MKNLTWAVQYQLSSVQCRKQCKFMWVTRSNANEAREKQNKQNFIKHFWIKIIWEKGNSKRGKFSFVFLISENIFIILIETSHSYANSNINAWMKIICDNIKVTTQKRFVNRKMQQHPFCESFDHFVLSDISANIFFSFYLLVSTRTKHIKGYFRTTVQSGFWIDSTRWHGFIRMIIDSIVKLIQCSSNWVSRKLIFDLSISVAEGVTKVRFKCQGCREAKKKFSEHWVH